eukprot:GEMP01008165.1.p1 GENE.GEMP01008165.1~~GEMP01008165.1.p1  ORF type:complete len:904 (+),score=215.10 GEMP01008165.1:78-2789(+)
MGEARYFSSQAKRGEIQQLRDELQNPSKDKKIIALKKIIGAMTVGKDVTSLFADCVNCMQTSSIDLKKLVYLYVINYAKAQPELAILAVNTFRKDTLDSNPLIRALAVRTMGCIGLDEITEYLLEPLRRVCKDDDPYVRKTAAMCVAKLYDINPDLVEDQGFIDLLKDMLGDANPAVVANAVAALKEISENSPKNHLQLSEVSVNKLLSALNECTEWGQVAILDALAFYNPGSSRAAEQILERVACRLSHSNAAVVMSTVKVMMKLLEVVTNSETIRSFGKKLCPPMVTLLSCEQEIQYCSLRNMNLMLQRRAGIVNCDVKIFFVKYDDPVYVKVEKLEIIVALASDQTIVPILQELKEYASEVDVEFVRRAVGAIGRVAIKLERSAERCVNVLLTLIETRVNYVVQEAMVVIRDIFRKYPNRYESVIGTLCENLDSLDEPEAKAAFIWILGEYCDRMDNSEEILESFLDTFPEEPAVVQLRLLTATVKVFLRSPTSSTQEIVTRVLKASTDSTDNPDLRDRGYIYWRLLSTDPNTTKKVVAGSKPLIGDNVHKLPSSVLARLVENIGTLASIYHQVPEAFVASQNKMSRESRTDSESDGEERIRKVQEQLKRNNEKDYRSNASGDSESPKSGSGSSTASSSSSPGGRPPPAGSPKAQVPPSQYRTPVISTVHTETNAGSNGTTGLRITAFVGRQNGHMAMGLQFENMSRLAMKSFMIQFNKNPFGLAPQSSTLALELPAGGRGNVAVMMLPNVIHSGSPPTNPLVLQVAIKCDVDIFYFQLPFPLSLVLLEQHDVSVLRESFRQDAMQKKEYSFMMRSANVLNTVDIQRELQLDGLYTLAARQDPNDPSRHQIFLAAKTVNDITMYGEILVQNNAIKLTIRTDIPTLAPCMQSLIGTALVAK